MKRYSPNLCLFLHFFLFCHQKQKILQIFVVVEMQAYSLQHTLVKSMTCPLCSLHPFDKEFVQCSAGHPICKSCYEGLDEPKTCPTCFCSFSVASRCLLLESLLKRVSTHRCPFPDCDFVTADGMIALRNHAFNGEQHICRGNFAVVEMEGGVGDTNISGMGCVTNTKGLRYEGVIINGRRHGKGKFYVNNGNRKILLYDGDWVNGLPDGNGRSFYRKNVMSIRYDGQWSKGKYHGKGRMYLPIGDNYIDGFFYEGEMDGAMMVYRLSDGVMLRCETYVMGIEMVRSPYKSEIDMPDELAHTIL